MKKLLFFLLFAPFILFAQKDYKHFEKYMPSSECGEIIHYEFYTISYCEQKKLSEWTIYYLDKKRIRLADSLDLSVARQTHYTLDNEKRGGKQSDFKYSGYDRGHLVPAKDMRFDKKAIRQVNYLTNVAPFPPSLNRGRWKILERLVSAGLYDWAERMENVVIITGWTGSNSFIKENSTIPVPNYYYKVLVDVKANRALAFMMPNASIEELREVKELTDYVVSFEELESKTGIDFFYKLNDDLEREIEGLVSGDINTLKKNQ